VKIFVTKRCLVSGRIDELEAEPNGRRPDKYVYAPRDFGGPVMYVLGRDAFTSYAEAVADANRRLQKKIAAVKRQLKKLERLVFK
jgi:hypothetical protein